MTTDDEEPVGIEPYPTPVRVCKRCSTQAQTNAEACPYCGTPYVKARRKLGRRGKRFLLLLTALLLVGGAAAGVVAKQRHDDQVAKEKAADAAAEKQRLAEEKAAKEEAEAQAELEKLERELRESSINSMRKSITKDARARVAEGLLDGPIYGTQCDRVGGGSIDDLDTKTTRFECLAINEKKSGGMVEGYRFTATMNWDKGSYQWRLGG